MKLSQKSITFIEEKVLKNIGLTTISDDNLQEIVDYISENYEIPLAQAKENGEAIDESLLELAAAVITEITTNPDW
jgi:hypothetical protein